MTSAVNKFKAWLRAQAQCCRQPDHSSQLAMAAIEELEAENERLNSLVSHVSTEHEACELKLKKFKEQYESTPERALEAVMEMYFSEHRGLELTISLECGYKVFTLTAEDITTDE